MNFENMAIKIHNFGHSWNPFYVLSLFYTLSNYRNHVKSITYPIRYEYTYKTYLRFATFGCHSYTNFIVHILENLTIIKTLPQSCVSTHFKPRSAVVEVGADRHRSYNEAIISPLVISHRLPLTVNQ